MAHIADLMVEAETTMGLNNYIARELSPSPSQDMVVRTAIAPILECAALTIVKAPEIPATPAEDKEKFVWRMHQPTEARNYQSHPHIRIPKRCYSVDLQRKRRQSWGQLQEAG
jgi:hypothetical protein